jgi:hypothetical protein
MTLQEFFIEVCSHLEDLQKSDIDLEEFAYWIDNAVWKYTRE